MNRSDPNPPLQKLLERFLPPYTFRAGYSAEGGDPFPPGFHHTSIDSAEPNSLDALYLFLKPNSGRDEILRGIDLLCPGGTLFLSIPTSDYDRELIEGIRTGLGLRFLTAVTHRPNRAEKRRLLVLRKSLFQKIETRSPLFSILIPHDTQTDFESILEPWRRFLNKTGIHDRCEIIVIDDGNIPTDQMDEIETHQSNTREPIVFLSHYRRFGTESAIRTGLAHAGGKYIVVDRSGGGVPPDELFPLLSKLLRRNRSGAERTTAAIGITSSKDRFCPQPFRNFPVRFFTGSGSPRADFMVLEGNAVREILDGSGGGDRIALLMLMKKRGWIIEEEAIQGNGIGKRTPSPFSLLKIWMKLTFG